jgi:hypothetical protein
VIADHNANYFDPFDWFFLKGYDAHYKYPPNETVYSDAEYDIETRYDDLLFEIALLDLTGNLDSGLL